MLLRDDSQDKDIQGEQMRGFDTYGVKEIYKQLYHSTTRDDDPYVNVRPFMDRLPLSVIALLSDPIFRLHMEAVAGPFLPLPSDNGTQRYLRVLSAVADAVDGLST
jgi:hypothetical protein